MSVPLSVAQLAETHAVRTDRDGLSDGIQSPGQPVDFVFGFQVRML